MDELRKLILEAMDKQDLSFREAAERSQGLISYAHLANIANGKHAGELGDRILTGIALAINLPVTRVRKAYGTTSTEPIEFRLPAKANYLSAKQRRSILSMVDAFLDGQNVKKNQA